MTTIINVKHIRALSFYDWKLSEQENIKKWIDLKIAKPFPSRDNIFNMHILVGSTEAQKRMGLIAAPMIYFSSSSAFQASLTI